MSYTNPAIVNDQSGAVLGQAIAKGAQNITAGIVGMEKQNQLAAAKAKKEAEKRKKEDEIYNTSMVQLSKTYNADKQRTAKLTKDQLTGIKDKFGINMSEVIDEGYRLEKAFLGNRTAANREAMEKNSAKRAELNEWMLNTGALVTNAEKWAAQAESDIEINNSYPSIGTKGMKKDGELDDGTNARELIKAFLNKDGYSYDYENGSLKITRGEGQKDLLFSGTDLTTITALFKPRKETGVATVQKGAESDFLLDGKVRNNMLATDGTAEPAVNGDAPVMPATKQIIDGKVYYRQTLNADKIKGVVDSQVRMMGDMIGEMGTDEKRRYLKDFDIPIDKWNSAPNQSGLLQEKIEDVVLQAINVKKEGDSYYYDKLHGNVPKPSTSNQSNPALTGNEYYTQANTNISTGLNPYVAESPTPEGYKESVTSQLNKLFKFDQAGNGNSMDFYLGGKSKKSDSNFRDLKFKYENGKLTLRAYTGNTADMDGEEDLNSLPPIPITSSMKIVDLINVNNKTTMSYEQKGKLAKLIQEKLGDNFFTGEL
tara:strand:+ start:517 stop:2136 length:1620 start_codon:yes stop_codon:yes gene_type:complete